MEFSSLDFDEAGGDFEPGEDDVEVVEGKITMVFHGFYSSALYGKDMLSSKNVKKQP